MFTGTTLSDDLLYICRHYIVAGAKRAAKGSPGLRALLETSKNPLTPQTFLLSGYSRDAEGHVAVVGTFIL
jgi:hypothetical protein